MTMSRVECPCCRQDWLNSVVFVELGMEAVFCPECENLWVGKEPVIGDSPVHGEFVGYCEFMDAHGRKPYEHGEMETVGPFMREADLTIALSECAALLRGVGEDARADKMEAVLAAGVSESDAVTHSMLGWFYGKGPLNSLAIRTAKGHRVSRDQQEEVDGRFARLSATIFDLVTSREAAQRFGLTGVGLGGDVARWQVFEQVRARVLPWVATVESRPIHSMRCASSRPKHYEVYVFYETDADLDAQMKSGTSEVIRARILQEFNSHGCSAAAGVTIVVAFDSHEAVLEAVEGNYFFRLRHLEQSKGVPPKRKRRK